MVGNNFIFQFPGRTNSRVAGAMKMFFAMWDGSKFPCLCLLEDIRGILGNTSVENFSIGNVLTAIDIVMPPDKR